MTRITIGTQIVLDKAGGEPILKSFWPRLMVVASTAMGSERTKPTIHDVARRAGVSATTVSHTFSGKGVVAADTRDRVKTAATELGYRPDALARGLRRNRLGVIGLVVRQLDTLDSALPEGVDYFLRFAGSAALAALGHGYALMLVSDPSGDDSPEAAYACDGYLITDPVADDPLLALLTEQRVPFLAVGRDPADPELSGCLDTDNAATTVAVLDHLRGQGAQRVALLVGTDANAWNADTEAAYRGWTHRHGQPALVVRRAESEGQQGGRDAAAELFDQPDRPDAVYCLTGRQAAGMLAALRDRSIEVPAEVLVASGSDSEHTRSATPAITSVDLCPDLLARVAVTMLVNILDTTDRPLPAGDIHGRLVIRDSTRGRSVTAG